MSARSSSEYLRESWRSWLPGALAVVVLVALVAFAPRQHTGGASGTTDNLAQTSGTGLDGSTPAEAGATGAVGPSAGPSGAAAPGTTSGTAGTAGGSSTGLVTGPNTASGPVTAGSAGVTYPGV